MKKTHRVSFEFLEKKSYRNEFGFQIRKVRFSQKTSRLTIVTRIQTLHDLFSQRGQFQKVLVAILKIIWANSCKAINKNEVLNRFQFITNESIKSDNIFTISFFFKAYPQRIKVDGDDFDELLIPRVEIRQFAFHERQFFDRIVVLFCLQKPFILTGCRLSSENLETLLELFHEHQFFRVEFVMLAFESCRKDYCRMMQ